MAVRQRLLTAASWLAIASVHSGGQAGGINISNIRVLSGRKEKQSLKDPIKGRSKKIHKNSEEVKLVSTKNKEKRNRITVGRQDNEKQNLLNANPPEGFEKLVLSNTTKGLYSKLPRVALFIKTEEKELASGGNGSIHYVYDCNGKRVDYVLKKFFDTIVFGAEKKACALLGGKIKKIKQEALFVLPLAFGENQLLFKKFDCDLRHAIADIRVSNLCFDARRLLLGKTILKILEIVQVLGDEFRLRHGDLKGGNILCDIKTLSLGAGSGEMPDRENLTEDEIEAFVGSVRICDFGFLSRLKTGLKKIIPIYYCTPPEVELKDFDFLGKVKLDINYGKLDNSMEKLGNTPPEVKLDDYGKGLDNYGVCTLLSRGDNTPPEVKLDDSGLDNYGVCTLLSLDDYGKGLDNYGVVTLLLDCLMGRNVYPSECKMMTDFKKQKSNPHQFFFGYMQERFEKELEEKRLKQEAELEERRLQLEEKRLKEDRALEEKKLEIQADIKKQEFDARKSREEREIQEREKKREAELQREREKEDKKWEMGVMGLDPNADKDFFKYCAPHNCRNLAYHPTLDKIQPRDPCRYCLYQVSFFTEKSETCKQFFTNLDKFFDGFFVHPTKRPNAASIEGALQDIFLPVDGPSESSSN